MQIWKVDDVSMLSTFLSSPQAAEGTFGLEYYSVNGRGQLYFFTESLQVQLGKPTPLTHVFDKSAMYYHVIAKKPTCLPFAMDMPTFWTNFQSPEDGTMLLQVLFRKRKEDWKNLFLRMYNTYLSGVDEPAHNKWFRKAQCFIADTLSSKAKWVTANVPIPQAEEKLQQDGFQTAIRLVLQGTKKKALLAHVKKQLEPLHFMNEWDFVPAPHSLLSYVQQRTFHFINHKHHILCTSEIDPLFASARERAIPVSLPLSTSTVWLPEQQSMPSYPQISDVHHPPSTRESTTSNLELSTDSSASKQEFVFLSDGARKKKVLINDDSIKSLSSAFKKLGILKMRKLDVIRIQEGPRMKKVTFRIPEGLSFGELQKQIKNIKAEMAVDYLSIDQGEIAGTAAILFKLDTFTPVLLQELLESDSFQRFKETVELPIILGVNEIGEPLYDCLARLRHLIIAGTTGSGKSVYINVLLLSLLCNQQKDDIAIFCIDPKRVELSPYRQFEQVREVITDMEQASDLLERMVDEMEHRYELLEAAGVKNIQQYNQHTGDQLHYIVVVIDEYADLVMEYPEVETSVRRLGQMARAAGIHMVIATQRPDAEIVTSKIKTNIRSRICFACASRHDYGVVLDRAVNFDLAGHGDGLCTREGVTGLTRFQAPLVAQNDEEEKRFLAMVAEQWNVKLNTSERNMELERLKLIIAETKEMRVKELQKMMGVRTAKVQEMMKQLVQDGWLIPPQGGYQSYKLSLSEEEIAAYLKSTEKSR